MADQPIRPVLLDDLTLFIADTYHMIMPVMFPAPDFRPGRPLNLPKDPSDLPEGATCSADGHRIVSVNEIFRDGKGREFRVLDVLGSGTYAYVFKCQSVAERGQFYALKIIKNHRNYRETGLAEVSVHRQLAKGLAHPGKSHVMIPVTSFEVDGHVCIVQPLLNRSLFDGLGQGPPVSSLLERTRGIMKQLLQALEFIHHLGIIHSDLKTDNVLLLDDDCQQIVLIDFGSATVGDGEPGIYIQSRFYRSPEVILRLPFDSKIDVWSAGCVAAELFLDFAPFGCESEFDLVHAMVALLGPFPDRMLSSSSRWQRFFDMRALGFKPKGDVNDIMLSRHCYHQVFEEIGVVPMDQMILGHIGAASEEEVTLLICFIDFVKRMLSYDPAVRISAAGALTHPFILGQELPDHWEPPDEAKKEWKKLSPKNIRKAMSLDLVPPDFLSMM
jgi:dual specificity protein kinase YAK1